MIPKRQNVRNRPLDYVVSGIWPHAQLEPSVPAAFAQAFARNVFDATRRMSLREIARTAELDPMTVRALLRGERYPDTVSVGKLEAAYRRLLWPSDDERLAILASVLDGGGSPQDAVSAMAIFGPRPEPRVLPQSEAAESTAASGTRSTESSEATATDGHLSVRVAADLDEAVRELAAERGVSISQVVRELLSSAVANLDPDDPDTGP